MPIMSCSKNGTSGFKFGDSGTCYIGEGARAKAERQGRAIEASKHGDRSNAQLEIKLALAAGHTLENIANSAGMKPGAISAILSGENKNAPAELAGKIASICH